MYDSDSMNRNDIDKQVKSNKIIYNIVRIKLVTALADIYCYSLEIIGNTSLAAQLQTYMYTAECSWQ